MEVDRNKETPDLVKRVRDSNSSAPPDLRKVEKSKGYSQAVAGDNKIKMTIVLVDYPSERLTD